MGWRDGGYLICEDVSGRVDEASTFTCSHCNAVVLVKAKANPDDLGGLCYGCMRMICPSCVGKGCDVIERKLERAEASYRARRSMGL